MNSCTKGKSGEREWASFLRSQGFDARRGQQHAGGPDAPDVVSSLPIHWEVKRVEKLNLQDACAQAAGECGSLPWAVAHRRNHAPWLVTVDAEFFMRLVRESGLAQPQPSNIPPTEEALKALWAKGREAWKDYKSSDTETNLTGMV